MKKILFLDGDVRSTLALIRDIAETNDFEIYVASEKDKCLCGKSRFTKKSLKYYDPQKSKINFECDLISIDSEYDFDIIVPTTDITYLAIYESKLYEKFYRKLLIPDKFSFFNTFNKEKLDEIALKANVKIIPRIDKSNLNYPFVLKPRFSRYYLDDKMYHGFRAFINSESEYKTEVDLVRVYDDEPLYQKIIDGFGYGVFVAAKDGVIFEWFAHERIREFPISGGASTYRKSIKVNDELRRSTEKLVRELKWTGIAMIEFKGDINKQLYLMEVNGRPWGSMDLAISSGIPFGKILIDLFYYDKTIDQLIECYGKGYRKNYYSRWIAGEVLYLRSLKSLDTTLIDKVNKVLRLLKFNPFYTSYDTFRISDPMPAIFETTKLVIEPIINRIRK